MKVVVIVEYVREYYDLYYDYYRGELVEDLYFGFFFQAEDGIRDIGVTGVQTCALPISLFILAFFPRLPLGESS